MKELCYRNDIGHNTFKYFLRTALFLCEQSKIRDNSVWWGSWTNTQLKMAWNAIEVLLRQENDLAQLQWPLHVTMWLKILNPPHFPHLAVITTADCVPGHFWLYVFPQLPQRSCLFQSLESLSTSNANTRIFNETMQLIRIIYIYVWL